MPSPDPQTLSLDQVRAIGDLMERERATAVRISPAAEGLEEEETPRGKVGPLTLSCYVPFHGWWDYSVRASGAWSMCGSGAWHAPPPEPESPVATSIAERRPPEEPKEELPDVPY